MIGNSNSITIQSDSNVNSCSQFLLPNLNIVPKKRISQAIIRAKLASKGAYYIELELFKQQLFVSTNTLQQTYARSCDKVRWYRSVFFAIGLFFLAVAGFAFYHNFIYIPSFLGSLTLLTKGFFTVFSLSLALLAISMGYSLCIAKEAGGHLAHKAKSKLNKLYVKKRLEQGLHRLFVWGSSSKRLALKQKYAETLELIEDQRDESIYLLKEIQQSPLLAPNYRELLFNQALAEMSEKLQASLQQFETTEL